MCLTGDDMRVETAVTNKDYYSRIANACACNCPNVGYLSVGSAAVRNFLLIRVRGGGIESESFKLQILRESLIANRQN